MTMMMPVGLETRQRAFKTPICPMLPKSEEEEEEEEEEEVNNARPPCGVCRTRSRKEMIGWGERWKTQPRFTTSQGGAKKIDQTLPYTASSERAARRQT